jgi:SAM-dependent methyltransferase
MTAQLKQLRPHSRFLSVPTGTAHAYDAAGHDYLAYADGDAAQPFNFNSRYCFADLEIWRRLDATLQRLAANNQRSLRLLDAGCGPGTWLRRTVLRARELGFTSIEAHGIDISPAMLALARETTAFIDDPAISIQLEEGDLTEALNFETNEFDITSCLYGVFNHLPAASHDRVAAELSRITGGTLFVTVRTVGSLPTIYVDGLDHARAFHQDNKIDWMEVDMVDGRHIGFPSHLFTADELRALFQPYVGGTALLGLDVFHSRFATNAHWNPPSVDADDSFEDDLVQLEQRYACDPRFINRAAHILLVGER